MFTPSFCPDAKDNSFTRSRSSSVTSIDRESREAISSLHFCESFPRKTETQVSPCLLVGTTCGSVMMVAISLPPIGDQRLQQPVGISSCGKGMNWLWCIYQRCACDWGDRAIYLLSLLTGHAIARSLFVALILKISYWILVVSVRERIWGRERDEGNRSVQSV